MVSAIGHETDTPILDLVADLRASTPTDAAKRIVPDAREEAEWVAQSLGRLRRAIALRLDAEQRRLTDLRSRPVLRDPSATIMLHAERLAEMRERLSRAASMVCARNRPAWNTPRPRPRPRRRRRLQRGYAILSGDEASDLVGPTRPAG